MQPSRCSILRTKQLSSRLSGNNDPTVHSGRNKFPAVTRVKRQLRRNPLDP